MPWYRVVLWSVLGFAAVGVLLLLAIEAGTAFAVWVVFG